MDPFYSLSISRRTRSRWEERARAMARANRNDNVGSSKKKQDFVRIDDDDDSVEEEEKSRSEPCVKRRRFDDPSCSLGSKANPYSIDDDDDDDDDIDDDDDDDDDGLSLESSHGISDDMFSSETEGENVRSDSEFDHGTDDDDDDEPVRSREKITCPSNGYRSNGRENIYAEKMKKEKKKNEVKKPSFSASSSSSSSFRKLDSPSEESNEACTSSKKNKKNKKKKEEKKKKKKKRQEPSSSSSDDYFESPVKEYTKKKMKKKRKQPSDSDSGSSDFRVTKKRDPKSKEPRDEVGSRHNKRQRRTKKASSSSDDDDDDDHGYKEIKSESNTVAKTKRVARITRSRQGPKSKSKSKSKSKGEQESGDKGKKKKKKKSGGFELFKVLVNSMADDAGKDRLENLAASEKKQSERDRDEGDVSATPLPLKFSFPARPIPPEKSEHEKEIDSLWTDLRVALASQEIGSAAACRAEGDDYEDDGPGCTLDLDALCERGKHQERLDDENGLYCSNCLKTITRIQEIYPSFGKNPSGRSRHRDPGNAKRSSFFDELGPNDSSCNNLTDTELRANAKTVWDMIPGVKKNLYPHQQEGFEFLWKHIAGGIERKHFDNVKSPSAGRGCIISHAPGTGKTLLTIVFLQALMKLHPKCLPVIIAPCSMLLTWGEEFRKWRFDAPLHNLNSAALSGSECVAAAALFKKKGGGGGRRSMRDVRALKVYSWAQGGSVLGVSYTTFEKLASPKADDEDRKLRHILLNSPGLIVLDEGHIPRNESSLIYQVLERVKTRKRIMLSGTPFQNNFEELYNTMEMVSPGFSKTQMAGYRKNDDRASQKKAARKDWKLLTRSFGEDAAQLNRIKAMIDPFVHIHRGEVLEESLPGLKETVVVLSPTELQETILAEIRKSGKEQLQRQWMVSLVSIHPSLAAEIKNETFSVTNSELNAKRLNPDYGVKMKFLMGLIRLCEAAKERVLVFSQYLDPLSLVREHLESEFGWTENNQVLYIDGKREMKERQSAINKFNDPDSSAKVFLVSTKAGGEGINLVGASRVVLLDVVWNPSVERQATRRAYRLGQKKFVYIYHLVASGTMEEEKYSRQVTKEKWSKMVFSSPGSGESRGPKAAQRVREDKVLNAMVQHESLKGIFEMIENKNHSGFLDLQAPSSSNSDF